MRTLRINWIMYRPGLAGGVKSNRLIAEAMVRRGHDVRLAHLSCPPPWPSPHHVSKFWRRLKLWRQDMKGRPHHLQRSTARLIPVPHEPILPEDVPDADVCIAGFWRTREWIERWPASKGIRAYFIRHYEIHSGEPERVKATYRMPGMKLVIARWLQRLMAEEFNDPGAVLVHNGVDRTQFDAPSRGRAAVPTVGLLYGAQDWKGAPCAFEAIRLAQRAIPNLRVLAFGRGEVAAEHTPPANFEFHLRPPQTRIPELYRSADLWIVPSTTEGFGMPGLEAAACRCPIVSTRCGGPEDYVQDGVTGYLTDVNHAPQMAEAIQRVLSLGEPEWRRMSEASYQLSREFDWDRSAEILEKALWAAIDERSAVRTPTLEPCA